jgi:hypothetical protein
MCFIRLYNRLAHLWQSFTAEQSKGMPCNQVLAATTGMRPYFRELHELSSEWAHVLLDLISLFIKRGIALHSQSGLSIYLSNIFCYCLNKVTRLVILNKGM